MQPDHAATEVQQRGEQRRKQDEASLYTLRQAVADILDDYEATAQTLDEVTAAVDGLEATDHADDVATLKQNLLSELSVEGATTPWEREGYQSKQAWLNNQ